jgi:hypothetical protein
MAKGVTLGRRFWWFLGAFAAWGLLGAGVICFLAAIPVGGIILTAAALCLVGILVDGRLVKERQYTVGDMAIYLLSIPLVLLAGLPFVLGFLRSSKIGLIYILGMLALGTLAIVEAVHSFLHQRGRT